MQWRDKFLSLQNLQRSIFSTIELIDLHIALYLNPFSIIYSAFFLNFHLYSNSNLPHQLSTHLILCYIVMNGSWIELCRRPVFVHFFSRLEIRNFFDWSIKWMKKRRNKMNEWKMGRKGGMKNALHNNLISFLLCLYPQDNVCESLIRKKHKGMASFSLIPFYVHLFLHYYY